MITPSATCSTACSPVMTAVGLKSLAYSVWPARQQRFSPADRLAECEHFVEAAHLAIPALARRIADDGICILVDLMGHTGINRSACKPQALRPAPIQVSFLGMLGTMGADFIDYLIGDRNVTPPEFAPEFTEKFVTMPHSYLIAEPAGRAFQPDTSTQCQAGKPDLRRRHGLPDTGFVFCSFSSTYKIDPRTFAAWMRIVSEVPDSVLWLYSPGKVFEANMRREAAAQGVAAERLVFAAFLPRQEHFIRHLAADLFLDTLQYNAAATASLALQAGLPVLTCPGDTFSTRVGASLLSSVGMPELIAANLDDYVQQAVDLARHPDRLRQLSDKLKAQIATAPLFDTPRFVRNLETAYRTSRDIPRRVGDSPRAIEVIER